MIELNGKYTRAKIFTDNVESEAIGQILGLCNHPAFEGAKIRVMPDVHAGAGCTIGTTVVLDKKMVIPNIVGVDIGCLDKDSEVLTPNGWIKICDYEGQEILVYNKDMDTAFFDMPYAYIKQPCAEFYHFHSTKGLDQMLSPEHKMLIWHGYKGKEYNLRIEMAKDVFSHHNQHTKGDKSIKTTFEYKGKGIDLSDELIRVFVMVSADGRIAKRKSHTHIELHFRKERKIERAKLLLEEADIQYSESKLKDGSTLITFNSQVINTKSLKLFYQASPHQLIVFINELYHWDGTIDEKREHKIFTSTNKENADVVQFVLATIGIRAGMGINNANPKKWNPCYSVYQTKNEYVGFPHRKFVVEPSIDGFKYCFTTSTGFFVMRRNNCISITGNCGVLTTFFETKEPINCKDLDGFINANIPYGMNVRETEHKKLNPVTKSKVLDIVRDLGLGSETRHINSIGSLGGGNHYLEIGKLDDGTYALSVHTGSRNLGKKVCEYFQQKAVENINGKKDLQVAIKEKIAELKASGREKQIESEIARLEKEFVGGKKGIAKGLEYIEGDDFDAYMKCMFICQAMAAENRRLITEDILSFLEAKVKDQFDTIHNYIEESNGSYIIRKGAISAKYGQMVAIPLNMRDGVIIGLGRGHKDWNCSAPHGAGRLLSRSKAKETISLEDFETSMEGIQTWSVNKSTLDESPQAYKPAEEIIELVKDTIDICHIVKPIYNFKAHD